MASVFDDPRPTLDPPTWEELEQKLGEPHLSFAVGSPDVPIPQGLLACCRVLHQPHCAHHVALSLVGCHFRVELPDGTTRARSPLRQVHEGDVLARPRDLLAAVEVARLMAIVTAEQQDGLLASMSFDVWSLNLEVAEIWRYLHAERERDFAASDDPSAALAHLPIRLIEGDDAKLQLARLMAGPGWHHAQTYADRALLLPSEVGHDGAARYVTEAVWGRPGDVSPAAEAILRDPTEVPG